MVQCRDGAGKNSWEISRSAETTILGELEGVCVVVCCTIVNAQAMTTDTIRTGAWSLGERNEEWKSMTDTAEDRVAKSKE